MRRVTALAIIISVIAVYSASATIINVPADQSTIQQGINASSNGDTVRVAPATYAENINFSGKNIVVGSWFLDAGDPYYISSTIIYGNQSGSVVSFVNGEDNTSIITGFTIENGAAENGGGISCRFTDPTISNNIISENFAVENGGGISCFFSDPTISNNIISGNYASNDGGGIYCYYSSPPIDYSTISGNTTGNDGGGIYCEYSSPPINYSTISGNTAGNDGGGIYCYNESNPTIINNTISGNTADHGGGIYCYASSPTISNNTISENSTIIEGGGIYCWYSDPVITNTIFWGDSAPTGPEIYLYGSSSVITYCDVQGGWAGEGNIDCDPLFCDPENGDFHLADASCCVGEGEGGVDIGAFGVGCGVEIPTLSEWGMLIMGLLLLAIGTVTVARRRKAVISKVT